MYRRSGGAVSRTILHRAGDHSGRLWAAHVAALARGAGGQRVAPGAAKRSRGLSGFRQESPQGGRQRENLVSHRVATLEPCHLIKKEALLWAHHTGFNRTPIRLDAVARLAGSVSKKPHLTPGSASLCRGLHAGRPLRGL